MRTILLACACAIAAAKKVAVNADASSKPLPTPHRQFTTRIETTAHQLNATDDYPPYKRYAIWRNSAQLSLTPPVHPRRQMTVYYDFDARRARIDYDPVPHMPPKSFVRRYDLGHEWMVMEIQREKECQKSRLREAMPMPRYPDAFIYMGESRVRGKPCDHWREDHGEEVVEFFVGADGTPLRLTTEAVDQRSPAWETTPLMTYDFFKFEPGAPAEDAFRMKASSTAPIFATDASLAIGACERVVQDMGFPYIHFMHTYYYA